MVRVVKHDRQSIAENVVTHQHMEIGVGDDFIRRPSGLDFLRGNAGDDWIAGGDSFGALAGESPDLFLNFNEDGLSTDSDMNGSIFSNQQIDTLRNRFDLVEGPSGWKLSDKLTGRDVVTGDCDHRLRTAGLRQ